MQSYFYKPPKNQREINFIERLIFKRRKETANGTLEWAQEELLQSPDFQILSFERILFQKIHCDISISQTLEMQMDLVFFCTIMFGQLLLCLLVTVR